MSMKEAVFANGCFWCTEAVFKMLKGVEKVVPGYTGGTTTNPTYDSVSTGNTGHAEALKVTYDPDVISYNDLLTIFFSTHNPTTRNRQGNDVGTQYRSAIMYRSDEEKQQAEAFIAELNAEKAYPDPVVTEITPFTTFYEAEDHHHNYYEQHPDQPYCLIMIEPKLEKMRQRYATLLK